MSTHKKIIHFLELCLIIFTHNKSDSWKNVFLEMCSLGVTRVRKFEVSFPINTTSTIVVPMGRTYGNIKWNDQGKVVDIFYFTLISGYLIFRMTQWYVWMIIACTEWMSPAVTVTWVTVSHSESHMDSHKQRMEVTSVTQVWLFSVRFMYVSFVFLKSWLTIFLVELYSLWSLCN